ncbi:MAG TPA: hypothetical protein VFL55_22780 [Acetobacteraceae bacterium]|nr:hypothetical protein [Acetobacteraceae bacterium]
MTVPLPLPQTGAVLGIDVGFSPTARSSAVCRLDWKAERITWTIRRFRALLMEQETTIAAVAGADVLQAAALDGPLRAGFDAIGCYRTAERMLTRRLGVRIGKPGQSSAPVGKKLNAAANTCARITLQRCQIGVAQHVVRIDDLAVVEAFPSSFLGVMLQNPAAISAQRGDRSDTFFERLLADGTLQDFLGYLLPGRASERPLSSVGNHDDRAALVCALTALAVAAGDFTAVGDSDGWIVLPPRRFVQGWAWDGLEANAREEPPGCLYQTSAWQPSDVPQVGITERNARDEKGAGTMPVRVQALIEKIQALPEERLNAVEDFVDFLQLREQQRALARDAAATSMPAFAAIWDNSEDDIYNAA